jgi:DNA invertase Pin-like site-specific DNA recombinase
MSPTTNVDEARGNAVQHLHNLHTSLTEEIKRVERAIAELGGKAARRAPGRVGRKSKAPSGAPSGAPKRRRRRGGTRADQAVGLIEKSPGISASEVAKTMKIKPNYLYRVLGDLEKEGRVKKQGRQYFPTG